MKFGIQFTSSLKKLEGISIHAPFFRSLDLAFVHDPLNSLGAKKHGGRYNQKGLFEVLYLAPDPETTLKEGRKSFSAYLPPTAVITAEVGLQKVLDLQDENVIKKLGIRREESISFLVGIEKKLPSFMPPFAPAFESRAHVELPAGVRVNISFP